MQFSTSSKILESQTFTQPLSISSPWLPALSSILRDAEYEKFIQFVLVKIHPILLSDYTHVCPANKKRVYCWEASIYQFSLHSFLTCGVSLKRLRDLYFDVNSDTLSSVIRVKMAAKARPVLHFFNHFQVIKATPWVKVPYFPLEYGGLSMRARLQRLISVPLISGIFVGPLPTGECGQNTYFPNEGYRFMTIEITNEMHCTPFVILLAISPSRPVLSGTTTV